MRGLVFALLLAAANPAQPGKKPAAPEAIAATGVLSRTDLAAIARLSRSTPLDPFKDHPSAKYGEREFQLVGRLRQSGTYEGGPLDGEWTYDRDTKKLLVTYHSYSSLTIFRSSEPAGSYIDPPSFQWTPMLAFRSWRGVSDEREASGLSGDLQTRSG